MPTYRNNTDLPINYEHKGHLYNFPPHKDYPAKFWLPYQELGLELVNADYPPVPESIIVSGTFSFAQQMERKFNIGHCDKYKLKLSVEQGTIKLFTGSSKVGVEVNSSYDVELNWDRAPYFRIVGVEGENVVRVDAEVVD